MPKLELKGTTECELRKRIRPIKKQAQSTVPVIQQSEPAIIIGLTDIPRPSGTFSVEPTTSSVAVTNPTTNKKIGTTKTSTETSPEVSTKTSSRAATKSSTTAIKTITKAKNSRKPSSKTHLKAIAKANRNSTKTTTKGTIKATTKTSRKNTIKDSSRENSKFTKTKTSEDAIDITEIPSTSAGLGSTTKSRRRTRVPRLYKTIRPRKQRRSRRLVWPKLFPPGGALGPVNIQVFSPPPGFPQPASGFLLDKEEIHLQLLELRNFRGVRCSICHSAISPGATLFPNPCESIGSLELFDLVGRSYDDASAVIAHLIAICQPELIPLYNKHNCTINQTEAWNQLFNTENNILDSSPEPSTSVTPTRAELLQLYLDKVGPDYIACLELQLAQEPILLSTESYFHSELDQSICEEPVDMDTDTFKVTHPTIHTHEIISVPIDMEIKSFKVPQSTEVLPMIEEPVDMEIETFQVPHDTLEAEVEIVPTEIKEETYQIPPTLLIQKTIDMPALEKMYPSEGLKMDENAKDVYVEQFPNADHVLHHPNVEVHEMELPPEPHEKQLSNVEPEVFETPEGDQMDEKAKDVYAEQFPNADHVLSHPNVEVHEMEVPPEPHEKQLSNVEPEVFKTPEGDQMDENAKDVYVEQFPNADHVLHHPNVDVHEMELPPEPHEKQLFNVEPEVFETPEGDQMDENPKDLYVEQFPNADSVSYHPNVDIHETELPPEPHENQLCNVEPEVFETPEEDQMDENAKDVHVEQFPNADPVLYHPNVEIHEVELPPEPHENQLPNVEPEVFETPEGDQIKVCNEEVVRTSNEIRQVELLPIPEGEGLKFTSQQLVQLVQKKFVEISEEQLLQFLQGQTFRMSEEKLISISKEESFKIPAEELLQIKPELFQISKGSVFQVSQERLLRRILEAAASKESFRKSSEKTQKATRNVLKKQFPETSEKKSSQISRKLCLRLQKQLPQISQEVLIQTSQQELLQMTHEELVQIAEAELRQISKEDPNHISTEGEPNNSNEDELLKILEEELPQVSNEELQQITEGKLLQMSEAKLCQISQEKIRQTPHKEMPDSQYKEIYQATNDKIFRFPYKGICHTSNDEIFQATGDELFQIPYDDMYETPKKKLCRTPYEHKSSHQEMYQTQLEELYRTLQEGMSQMSSKGTDRFSDRGTSLFEEIDQSSDEEVFPHERRYQTLNKKIPQSSPSNEVTYQTPREKTLQASCRKSLQITHSGHQETYKTPQGEVFSPSLHEKVSQTPYEYMPDCQCHHSETENLNKKLDKNQFLEEFKQAQLCVRVREKRRAGMRKDYEMKLKCNSGAQEIPQKQQKSKHLPPLIDVNTKAIIISNQDSIKVVQNYFRASQQNDGAAGSSQMRNAASTNEIIQSHVEEMTNNESFLMDIDTDYTNLLESDTTLPPDLDATN